MPGLGVHRGDHPVLGHPAGDPEHPIGVLVQVLADHAGQQRRRLRHRQVQSRPSSSLSSARASLASASTSASRAAGSFQSQPGFPAAG